MSDDIWFFFYIISPRPLVKMNPEKPHYHKHRKRLKERFTKAGLDAFQDYEVLELLLTYAIPRKDVKPLAKNLLNRFGGLKNILDASLVEIA